MLSKKAERILKCFMVFVLALSTLNLVYAEDTSSGLNINNITFDVKGHVTENDDEKSKVDITINIENKSEEELTLDSIKSNFSDAIEYDKNSKTSFVEEDHQIVLKDQTISANDNVSYSYTISLLKDKSFDTMTWSINGKEVKSISSIDKILSDEDIEKLNQKEDNQTANQDSNDKATLGNKNANKVQSRTVNEGTFENYGPAIIVIDGTTITVSSDWNYVPNGSKCIVEKIDPISFPLDIAHGQLESGIGYRILIKDVNGNPIQNAVGSFDVRIENSEGLDIPEGSVAIAKDRDMGMAINTTATITETEASISTIPLDGEYSYIYVGNWNYSNRTFESQGGQYNLGYILKNYNGFVEGNYKGSHTVGSLIVGGTTEVSIGGLTTNDPNFVNTASSWFKGEIMGNSRVTVRTHDDEFATYFGSANQGKQISVTNQLNNNSMPYYYANNFVDFDKAFNAMDNQVEQLFNQQNIINVDVNNSDATLEKDSYEVNGNTIKIYIGKDYLFNNMDGITVDLYAPESATEEEKNNPLLMSVDTIILCNGEKVNLNNVWVNGEAPLHPESGTSAGLVFITPEATSFTGHLMTGHVYAPKADVEYTGGDYNGCVITRGNFVAEGEGHMMPYSGQQLLPASTNLKFQKRLDGNPTDIMFEFEIQASDEHGNVIENGYQATIYNTSNGARVDKSTSPVDTIDITLNNAFTQQKTFYYKLTEKDLSDNDKFDNYTFSTQVYLVEINVIQEGNQFKVDYVKYYKLNKDPDFRSLFLI